MSAAVPLSSPHPLAYFPSFIKGVSTCPVIFLSTPMLLIHENDSSDILLLYLHYVWARRLDEGQRTKEKEHVVFLFFFKSKASAPPGIVCDSSAGSSGKCMPGGSQYPQHPRTGNSLVHFRNWKWHCSWSCHLSNHTFLDFGRLSMLH